MQRFDEGDRIRIDIPDTTDPDFDRYHGQYGMVIDVIGDDAGIETGDERDSCLFRVEVDDGSVVDLRWRDLRPEPDTTDHE